MAARVPALRWSLVTMATRHVVCTALGLVLAAIPLAAQMPDLRQMSGQPLPSGDLPAGSVSVRVVRQAIVNNVAGARVEVASPSGGGMAPRTLTTDAGGRAVFSDLPIGAVLQAVATVDGEQLVSQPFTVPAAGGLRILLAAGLAGGGAAPSSTAGAAAAPALPASPGVISLGGQSRLVVELAEGSVEVFCLVDLMNASGSAAALQAPIVFEIPRGATNATVLEGSSPLAKVEGSRVAVAGPLPAGATSVQFAYRVPTDGPALQVRQALPLAAGQMTVIVRKHSGLTVTMPGETGRRDVAMEGRSYLILSGASGGAVELSIEGLPAHATWPRYVAIGIAVIVMLTGVWAATTGGPAPRDADRLRAERAERFDELVSLERKLSKQGARDGWVERRARLIDEVAELDLALEALQVEGAPSDAGDAGGPVRAGARASTVQ